MIRQNQDGQVKAGLAALSIFGKDADEKAYDLVSAFYKWMAKVRGEVLRFDISEALPLFARFLLAIEADTLPHDTFLKAAQRQFQGLDAD